MADESTLTIADPKTQKQSLDEANKVLELDAMIKRLLAGIKTNKEEQKKYQEMLESVLQSDPIYQEREKEAKEAAKNKAQIKTQIVNQPQNMEVNEKIKSLKDQNKELKEGLSFYLQEYQRKTGATEFEDEDGKVKRIVYVAKLVTA